MSLVAILPYYVSILDSLNRRGWSWVEVEGVSVNLFFPFNIQLHITPIHNLHSKYHATLFLDYRKTMSPVEGSPAKPEDYPHFMSMYV